VNLRRGIVQIDGERVGTLVEDGPDVTFAYDAEYASSPAAIPVSLTLPVGEGPWTTRGLHPFFAGLLPEGWLRTLVETKLHVDDNDQFGLLLATGADCVGAVEIIRATSEDGTK
jgi:serine/threonine-protein kinase HipA